MMPYAALSLVLTGVLGYFLVVFHFAALLPSVRNGALPNWILIALGLALSVVAVRRAAPGRNAPRVVLGVNVVVAALFAYLLYVVTALPVASGPTIGVAAPEFALADHTGKAVRLSEFRGAPVLLVFYRGHW